MNQDPIISQMNALLKKQKESFLAEGPVSFQSRIDRIDRAIDLLLEYRNELSHALVTDFGSHSIHYSMLDIAGSLDALKNARKNLRKWMKPEKRKPGFPFNLLGARAWIEYQPKGVVGVITPWNAPIFLTFSSLADILSAGNRCMIKPSEFTPATSELIKKIISEKFDPSEVAVFLGPAEVGEAFSGLAFDHLLFTGSTSVGKHVMIAAAENMVPVTLELGGKSPAIIGRSVSIEVAADRLVNGKMSNAGQICIAPDYLLVPEDKSEILVASLQNSAKRLYPTLKDNPDCVSIINQRHFERLKGYLQDAREKGGELIEINPAGEDFAYQSHWKLPLTLVLNPADEMRLMREEIFGPILPIKTYRDIHEAIDYVNARPRPLALYYFGNDRSEERRVLTHTISGSVVVNDVIVQVIQNDLPFGGVGPSGMGFYHGSDGFKTFSHKKAIFKQAGWDFYRMFGLFPPYGKKFEKMIDWMIRK